MISGLFLATSKIILKPLYPAEYDDLICCNDSFRKILSALIRNFVFVPIV